MIGCCKSGASKDDFEQDITYTVVLIRHGETTFDKENLFTGWADCPLSERGVEEAKYSGQLLKEAGYSFDLAYTSILKRAIKTLWLILEEMNLMYIPIEHSWRLNERHYGALQGVNKQETVDKHGIDQVTIWRKSYGISPPKLDESSEHYPGHDPRYEDVDTEDLPFSESLELTGHRFMIYWKKVLVPEIKSGRRVLISSHGSTFRSLLKHLDGLSKKEIVSLNIPTGVPLVYTLDANMKPIAHVNAIAPLKGLYLGDLEKVKAQINSSASSII